MVVQVAFCQPWPIPPSFPESVDWKHQWAHNEDFHRRLSGQTWCIRLILETAEPSFSATWDSCFHSIPSKRAILYCHFSLGRFWRHWDNREAVPWDHRQKNKYTRSFHQQFRPELLLFQSVRKLGSSRGNASFGKRDSRMYKLPKKQPSFCNHIQFLGNKSILDDLFWSQQGKPNRRRSW